MRFIILIISLLAISQLAAQNAPDAKSDRNNINKIWVGTDAPYIRFDLCTTEEDRQQCSQRVLTGLIWAGTIYPKEARAKNVQGIAEVSFTVNADGTVSDFKLVRPIPSCDACNEEAVRVVRTVCQNYTWIPTRRQGITVAQTVSLPVAFKYREY